METVICQRCFVENNPKNSFCQNCDYPLGKAPAKPKRKSLIGLLIFFLILFLAAAGTLVYVDYHYPDYGLRNRLSLAANILFQKDWLEKHSDLNQLQSQLENKKKNLDLLAKELEAEKSKVDHKNSEKEKKEKVLNEQLERLEMLENKLKQLEGN